MMFLLYLGTKEKFNYVSNLNQLSSVCVSFSYIKFNVLYSLCIIFGFYPLGVMVL
jgi:hypothetical protein